MKDTVITFIFILLIGVLIMVAFNYLGNNSSKNDPQDDPRVENCGPGGTWC